MSLVYSVLDTTLSVFEQLLAFIVSDDEVIDGGSPQNSRS